MFDRLKLHLGIGPAEEYVTMSPRRRTVLVLCQVLSVVALVVADSWQQRGAVVAVAVVAMLAVGFTASDRAGD